MKKPKPNRDVATVTPKMLAAGIAALRTWRNASDAELAAAVYRAMLPLAPPGAVPKGPISPSVLQALRLLGYKPALSGGRKRP